jgi:hypothetical protein
MVGLAVLEEPFDLVLRGDFTWTSLLSHARTLFCNDVTSSPKRLGHVVGGEFSQTSIEYLTFFAILLRSVLEAHAFQQAVVVEYLWSSYADIVQHP